MFTPLNSKKDYENNPILHRLLLCALTNSPCQSLDSLPAATADSQRGTPGVAIQQGVVNVAELTRWWHSQVIALGVRFD